MAILTAALVSGCKHAPLAATARDEAADPICNEALDAVRRAPTLESFGPKVSEARARGEGADVSRLAAVACPYAWVPALRTSDRAIAFAVGARCADAESVLALACSLQSPPSTEESDVFVQWAALHPVARGEDGPALAHTRERLELLTGADAARDALSRVAVPSH